MRSMPARDKAKASQRVERSDLLIVRLCDRQKGPITPRSKLWIKRSICPMEKNSSQKQKNVNPPNGSAKSSRYISKEHSEFEDALSTTLQIFLRKKKERKI